MNFQLLHIQGHGFSYSSTPQNTFVCIYEWDSTIQSATVIEQIWTTTRTYYGEEIH